MNDAMDGGLLPPISSFSLDLHGETQKRAHLSCLSSAGRARTRREQRGQASQNGSKHGQRERVAIFGTATQFSRTRRTIALCYVTEQSSDEPSDDLSGSITDMCSGASVDTAFPLGSLAGLGINFVDVLRQVPRDPELYRCRWQVELFFKWIKRHLRIKVFFERLNLSASLYEMLQILSLTMFEKMPLDQLPNKIVAEEIQFVSANQLNLFE